MSLINEALKKARVEAARQDALERGLPHAPLPQHMPRLRRSRKTKSMNWLLIATVMILAGALVAVLLDPSDAPPESQQRAAEPVDSSGVAGTVVEAETTESPPEQLAALSAERGPAPELVEAVDDPAPPPSPPVLPVPEPRPSPEVVERPRPAPPKVEASVESAGEARARSPSTDAKPASPSETIYVVEAKLPSGEQFSLDFIVWSESKPFAQINGKFVEVGAILNGHTIEEIGPDAVHLRGSGGRVVLKSQ